jgi:hypothetical protein
MSLRRLYVASAGEEPLAICISGGRAPHPFKEEHGRKPT